MIEKISSFFARFRRKPLSQQLNEEIFSRMFPHLEQESDEGYPFASDTEMMAQAETMDVRALLDDVEQRIEKLPAAYGQCFRYLLRKDLAERLRQYAEVAKRRTPPAVVDPRWVARHA